MKPLRLKIQDEATSKQAPLHVIEKDYALSYVLAGIAKQPDLSHTLIFKGGTALKKLFFGDYRFSEDLDFSVINAPKDKQLENAMLNAIHISQQLLNEYGSLIREKIALLKQSNRHLFQFNTSPSIIINALICSILCPFYLKLKLNQTYFVINQRLAQLQSVILLSH
jgi:predicted nucleotidyltransferase component of viral defense system